MRSRAAFFSHSIRRNHHPSAVITGLAVDKDLFAPIVAEQSEKSSHVCVFRMEAIPGNRDEAHSQLGYLSALDFKVPLAQVYYYSDAHVGQFPKPLPGRLRTTVQSRAHLTEIRHAFNCEPARNGVFCRDRRS